MCRLCFELFLFEVMEIKCDSLSCAKKIKLQKQQTESLRKLPKIDKFFTNSFTNEQQTEFERESGTYPDQVTEGNNPPNLCEVKMNVNPSGPRTSDQK